MTIIKLTEKDKLELVEKKIEIQKKRLELRKEKMDLKYNEERKMQLEEQKVLIEKLARLQCLLSDTTIDADKTILGSEPKYKQLINEKEQIIVKAKLFQLLKNL